MKAFRTAAEKAGLAALVLLLTVGLAACTPDSKKSVATVNGEKISVEEFKYFLTNVKAQVEAEQGEDRPDDFWETAEVGGKKVIDTAKDKALEEAVKAKITRQKAEQEGIKLTSQQREDINSRVGRYIAQHGKDGVDDFLAQYGLTMALLEKQLEDSYYQMNLIEKVAPDVGEEEAKAFFNDKVVRVKHVLIMTVDQQSRQALSTEALEAAAIKADDIQKRAKEGADFDALVKEYSEDPGSTSSPDGYYIGKGFALGQQGGMVTEFETASLELEVGSVSDIVETQYGYHIIKRYENQESEFETAREELISRAKSARFDELLEGWKSEAKIERNEKEFSKLQ